MNTESVILAYIKKFFREYGGTLIRWVNNAISFIERLILSIVRIAIRMIKQDY